MATNHPRPLQRAEAALAERCGLEHALSIGSKTSPLALLVHGRGGNMQVMSAFRGTLPPEMNILCPQAYLPEMQGYSWWLVDQEDSQERIAEASQRLQLFLHAALETYDLNPSKTLGVGFSQGAALISLLAQEHSTLFDGVALLAGFVIEQEKGELPGGSLELPPIFIAHGRHDQIVPVARARQGKEFLERRGGNVTYVEDEVSHKVGAPGMRGLKEWVDQVLRS